MVMAFQKFSGLSPKKVVGMAGILDTSRFKLFLSLELDVPVKEIEAMVMGGHGILWFLYQDLQKFQENHY